jgi:hypothetical protein
MSTMGNPFAALDQSMLSIEHSVGKGGSNRPGDVQQIQLMLNVAHLDPQNSFRMASVLSMDGICGPMTLSGILAYQENKMNGGGPFPLFAADGLITAHRASFMDGNRFGYSTLWCLNWDNIEGLPRVNFAEVAAGSFAEPLLSTVILPLRKMGIL